LILPVLLILKHLVEHMHIAQLRTHVPFCHHGENVRFADGRLKTAVIERGHGGGIGRDLLVEVFVEGVEGYVLDWCHGEEVEFATDEEV